MIRNRFRKVLLAASDTFPDQLLAGHSTVKHVSSPANIFPAIYELNPDLIIFDHDFMGKELEKVLRRLKANNFYSKTRICIFKNTQNPKADSLLQALGADEFIYREDLVKNTNEKKVLNTVNALIEVSVLKWVSGVSH